MEEENKGTLTLNGIKAIIGIILLITIMSAVLNNNGYTVRPKVINGQVVVERYDKNGKELKAPPKKMRHEPPKGPELNLTEKQKAQADKIREASKQKIKPIRQEIHEIKNQLWEIRENDNLTEEQKHEKAV